MFADVEGLVMTSQATKDSMDGDGIDMSFVGSITSTRSIPRFLLLLDVYCLALFTETPDAISM